MTPVAAGRALASLGNHVVLFGNCRTFQILDSCVLISVKRSLVLGCLVVLVSLALACGNAHAALHLGAAHPSPAALPASDAAWIMLKEVMPSGKTPHSSPSR
jgi:hypothetical protein